MGRAFEKRPKAQVNFSDQKFARRRRCCRKLHIFIFFSKTNGPISTKLRTKHPWWRKFKFVQIKDPSFSKGTYSWNSENKLTKFKDLRYGQFQPNFTQSNLGWGGFKFVQMKNYSILNKLIMRSSSSNQRYDIMIWTVFSGKWGGPWTASCLRLVSLFCQCNDFFFNLKTFVKIG